jgi:hypothetical protein
VSRADAYPLADSLDHIGSMTRSAADAGVMLGIIAGRDPQDPTSVAAPVPDYLAELDTGLTGLRIGVDERACTEEVDPAVTRMLKDAAEVLRHCGAVITPITFPATTEVVRGWMALCSVETAIAHEATYPAKASLYGPVLAGLIEQGRRTSGMTYAKVQSARQKFAGDLAALFGEVDLILSPSQPYPTPTNAFMEKLGEEEGAIERLLRFTAPHNMSGSPTICLPGGFDANGLPLGFQQRTATGWTRARRRWGVWGGWWLRSRVVGLRHHAPDIRRVAGTAGAQKAKMLYRHAARGQDVVQEPAPTLQDVEWGGARACAAGFAVRERTAMGLERDNTAVGEGHFAARRSKGLPGRGAVRGDRAVHVPGGGQPCGASCSTSPAVGMSSLQRAR